MIIFGWKKFPDMDFFFGKFTRFKIYKNQMDFGGKKKIDIEGSSV